MAKVKKSVRSANEDAMKFKNYLDSLSIRDHGKIITELADKMLLSPACPSIIGNPGGFLSDRFTNM